MNRFGAYMVFFVSSIFILGFGMDEILHNFVKGSAVFVVGISLGLFAYFKFKDVDQVLDRLIGEKK